MAPQTLLALSTSRVKCVQFHPRRPWVMLAMHDGFVEIWDYVVCARVDRFLAHSAPVRAAAFHPTQAVFATGADDRTVKLWDLDSRKLLATLAGHTDYVRFVDFHRGSRPWLVSSSDDATARVWNWQSRQCVASIVGHREFVMCAKFHPTDDLLATASLDCSVRVWDLSAVTQQQGQQKSMVGKLTQMLLQQPGTIISQSTNGEAHTKGANWVCWDSEDGLYSSGDDMQIRAWRLNRGKHSATTCLGPDAMMYSFAALAGHKNNVNAVEVGRDSVIISASSDQCLRVHEAKSRSFVGSLTTADFGQQYSEQTRFWCVSQHPTESLWAAGHDQGLVVFRLVNNGPVPSDQGFFVRQHILCQLKDGKEQPILDLKKNAASKAAFGGGKVIAEPRTLHAFGAPFPTVVGYDDGASQFLNLYYNAKVKEPERIEITGKAVSSGQEIAFIQQKTIRHCKVTVGGLSNVGEMPLERAVSAVGFLGSSLIVAYEEGTVEMLDSNYKTVKTSSLPSAARSIVQSADGTLLGISTSSKVLILDSELKIQSYTTSASKVHSIAFGSLGKDAEPTGHTLIFANCTHVCYLASKLNLDGVITSINRQVYIQSVDQATAVLFDDEGGVVVTTFDSKLCGLFTAIADNRTGDIAVFLHRVRKANLGVAAVGKLIRAGMSRYAIQLLGDDYKKLKESLAVDLGILDDNSIGDRQQVYDECLLQNRHKLAFKVGNCEQKAFINAVNFSSDEILYKSATVQQKLNAQMLQGDDEAFLKTLVQSEMHAAALVFARSRGLPEDTIQYKQGECKRAVATGKKLTFKKRTGEITDWSMRKVEEIVIPEDADEKPEIAVVKEGSDAADEKPKDETLQSPQENKEQPKKKAEWSSAESSSEPEEVEQEGEKVLPLLNPHSQALKTQGFSKDSAALAKILEESKQAVTESSQYPFTAQQLDGKLRQAHRAFTEGEFQQSFDIFQETYIKYKLLVAAGTVTQKQITTLFVQITTYLKALTAELIRRKEDTPEDAQAELLVIFASQKMEPSHRTLVAKLAMNKLKKQYTKQAKLCAAELVKLAKEAQNIENPAELVQKAEKIAQMKDAKGVNERVNAVATLADIAVDWSIVQIADKEMQFECSCCGCGGSQRGACLVCGAGEMM